MKTKINVNLGEVKIERHDRWKKAAETDGRSLANWLGQQADKEVEKLNSK